MKLTALPVLSLFLLAGHTHGVARVVVAEDDDAILPCSPSNKKNLIGALFDWTRNNRSTDVIMYESGIIHTGAEEFKRRVSHFKDELENGNASIKIRRTKIEDSGIYTCDLPHLEPAETFQTELVVEPVLKDRYGQKTGASPKPNITTVSGTDGVQLQCVVEGASPKPEVQFQDSAGNIVPAEKPQVIEGRHRYTVMLITTVTKTDLFRCVATQEELHHQTSAEIYVTFSDTHSKVDVTGWVSGYFLGFFSLAVVQALLVATRRIKIQFIKGLCQQRNNSSNNHVTDAPENHVPLTSPV